MSFPEPEMPPQPERSDPETSKLDRTAILSMLQQINANAVGLQIEVEQTLDSTSDHMARLRAKGRKPDVVVANEQTAGRGRRGRHWLSPPGAGLYLSFGRAFNRPIGQLGAISLIAGLATAEALEASCEVVTGLKWPNDVQVDGRKLAGCLVDIEGSPNAPTATIGIGINIDFRGQPGPDQPWTDLASSVSSIPDRNRLAALLISHLHQGLSDFEQQGFGGLQEQWGRRDVLYGQEIVAMGADAKPLRGRATGLNESGHLLLEQNGQIRALSSGEVSLLRRV
jgi:BirA family biotin operon repressor/biotin-[acetyl-CoA-carboxylase] ligase